MPDRRRKFISRTWIRPVVILGALLLGAAPGLSAWQGKDAKPAPAQPRTERKPLTPEEREIMKNRELLEFLELFQHFDQVRYLDFLKNAAEPKPPEKAAPKTEGKKDADKKKI